MTSVQYSPEPLPTGRTAGIAAGEEPTTARVLTYVLQRPAHAHHFYEPELPGPHADRPYSYAAAIAETLADRGDRLVLAPGRGGVTEQDAERNTPRPRGAGCHYPGTSGTNHPAPEPTHP